MSSRCPHPIELSRAATAGAAISVSLQAHLDTCARCTAELESHRNVADDTRILPAIEPTADHARVLRAAILTAARTSSSTAPRRVWMFGVAAATALAAAAAIFLLVRNPQQPAYRGSIHAHDGAQYVRVAAAPDEIVRLTEGTLTVEVSPLAPTERFRVITGDGEVEVRGTMFDVSASGDKLVAVRVMHGKVEVRASGAAPRLLVEGERWDMKLAAIESVPKKTPLDDVAAPVSSDVVVTGETGRDETGGAGRGATPGAGRDATANVARDATGEASRGATPGASRGETANARGHATPGTSRDATRSPGRDATTGNSTTGSAGRSSTRDNRDNRATPAITLDTAQRPATSGAPKRPIEVLFDRGWAALAAGKPREAATAFEHAASSAPSDPLAEDAWFWRATALARAKSGDAAAALEQFLGRYPRSNRAGEASAMLGWIVIANDLDRAEKLFTSAAKDRVPAVRASGEKGLAAIAKRRAQR